MNKILTPAQWQILVNILSNEAIHCDAFIKEHLNPSLNPVFLAMKTSAEDGLKILETPNPEYS